MSPRQRISEDGLGLRRYRTELPNLIDDLGLSVHEFRLYAHYKRVCGASGGCCYEKIRTTAKRCRMRTVMVTKARKGLEKHGLIRCSTNFAQTIDVRIVDVWAENFREYADWE